MCEATQCALQPHASCHALPPRIDCQSRVPVEQIGDAAAQQLPHISCTFILVETTLWCSSAWVVAHLAGSSVAVIFGLIGALGASSVMFIIPAALWFYSPGWGGCCSPRRLLPTAVLLAPGLGILSTGTLFTIQNALQQGQQVGNS